MKTELWLAANPDAAAAEAGYLTNIPAGRLGQPEDIANAAFMLASDDAAALVGLCYSLPICIRAVAWAMPSRPGVSARSPPSW